MQTFTSGFITENGDYEITLSSGGGKMIVVEGELDGANLTFTTTYFRIADIPIAGPAGDVTITDSTAADIFFIAGGMKVTMNVAGGGDLMSFKAGIGV